MFHKVRGVTPLSDHKLRVVFAEGATKIYDVAALFKQYKFLEPLRVSPELFRSAHVAPAGAGVIWNDDIDIYCEELWFHGVEEKS